MVPKLSIIDKSKIIKTFTQGTALWNAFTIAHSGPKITPSYFKTLGEGQALEKLNTVAIV